MPFLVKGKIGLWPGRVRELVSKIFIYSYVAVEEGYLTLWSVLSTSRSISSGISDISCPVNKITRSSQGLNRGCVWSLLVLLGYRRIRVGEGEADIQRAGSNFECGMLGVLLEWFPWIYKGWRVRASWLYRWCVFLSIATVATVEVVWPKVPLIDQYR